MYLIYKAVVHFVNDNKCVINYSSPYKTSDLATYRKQLKTTLAELVGQDVKNINFTYEEPK